MRHDPHPGDRRSTRRRRETGAATVTLLALTLVAGVIGLRPHTPDWPTAVSRAQPFTDTIIESGTLAAQQMTLYSSTIPGVPAKIIEIAPEGLPVRTGDLIARFDSTQFEMSLERERASLGEAQADVTRLAAELRLERLRAQDDLAAANQQVENGERGLANELQGRGQVAVVEVDAALADSERELARARTNVEDLKPLLRESFITRSEFDRAQQALGRAEDQARLARAKRDSLVQYERPAATTKAQAELNVARDGLIRQAEAASARAAQRGAGLAVAVHRVREIEARIAFLNDQITRATILALGPGLVVYRELFFDTERRKPQVGDTVFSNQPIIAVPDSSQLLIEMRVREVDLQKVSLRQPVSVRVDAYPELRLSAIVATIGALAQEDPARAGARFFSVTVQLTSSESRLRTGMTATAEIEVSSLPSAVVVPVEAVFEDHGHPYLVVIHNGRPERRPVSVAARNESLAAIAIGLRAGEVVLLTDPTSGAS